MFINIIIAGTGFTIHKDDKLVEIILTHSSATSASVYYTEAGLLVKSTVLKPAPTQSQLRSVIVKKGHFGFEAVRSQVPSLGLLSLNSLE